MISKISHITLFVKNQDEALAFYINKLGFLPHTDAMFGPNMRWLTITAAKQKDVEIALMLAENQEEQALVGKQAGHKPLMAFSSDNIDQTYEMLKRNGVKITQEPKKEPWGTSMSCQDLYGNQIYIVMENA
jgi:predicted enzyme related to lactoylglutathione lyase